MDGHSGVRVLTDKLGNLTDTASYDAYGNVTNPLSSEFGYRGESFEDLTRLQYLRARYYEPSTGRFLGVDPVEGDVNSPVSRHRYLYGNANPVSYSDPSGKFSIGEAVATIAILGILSTSFQAVTIGHFYNQSGGKDLSWTGLSYGTSYSGTLVGLPSWFSATAVEISLTSGCYNNTKNHALWLAIGVGFSLSPSTLPFGVPAPPVSGSIAPSITVSSPYILGNDSSVLSGLYNIVSGNFVLGPFGTSYSWFGMGFGYGKVTDIAPWQNYAVGFDLSVGAATGVAIPIYSYKSNC
jgi:RHS repeat-associated protein